MELEEQRDGIAARGGRLDGRTGVLRCKMDGVENPYVRSSIRRVAGLLVVRLELPLIA